MSRRAVAVPIEVRRKAETLGAPGRRWLDGLGDVVAGLEREWDVVVGATLSGGTDSYVAEATTADGGRAVLKLALPSDAVTHQIATLAHVAGRGYVRLLRHDEARRAMLQERLGTSLCATGLPVRAQIEVICSTLRRAWAVAPEPTLMSGGDKARWLGEFIAGTWRELDEPCPERVVERALAFAAARRDAFDPETAVLVHGDPHCATCCGTTPTAASSSSIPTACSPSRRATAVPMREYNRDLLEAGDVGAAARDRCALLSAITGVDSQPIWEWGFLERVSSGLLLLRIGGTELGIETLDVAEAIVSA